MSLVEKVTLRGGPCHGLTVHVVGLRPIEMTIENHHDVLAWATYKRTSPGEAQWESTTRRSVTPDYRTQPPASWDYTITCR